LGAGQWGLLASRWRGGNEIKAGFGMSVEAISNAALSVSVIVTLTNHRDRAVRTVHSVLEQTHPPDEILVQDDAPQHATAETLAGLGGRVSYQHQSQRGLAAARNRAIRRSRGELMALLDADDVWTTDKLERCVAYMQAHPEVDVVYSATSACYEDGSMVQEPRVTLPSGWLRDELFEHNFIHDSAVVFRRRVWERMGGFDESLPVSVGHNFWLRAASGHRFGAIDEPLTIRTVRRDERSPTERLRDLSEHAKMLFEFYEYQGGAERLDRRRAGRTIAAACRRAGWAALWAGDGTLSEIAFTVALGFRPTWFTRLMYCIATTQRRWNGQSVYQPS
jgi:glycosyltransferase involved in cell wall biosynthesis